MYSTEIYFGINLDYNEAFFFVVAILVTSLKVLYR